MVDFVAYRASKSNMKPQLSIISSQQLNLHQLIAANLVATSMCIDSLLIGRRDAEKLGEDEDRDYPFPTSTKAAQK